ncbi:MAG: LptF/LptG family permease [Thermoguttaceae bacterium]|nr:LptF/LptG family permease [Thermoguttaceae bacterium]
MNAIPFFTIVDRYFMRKFLFVAFALLFIGTSLFVIFDILPNADDVNQLFQKSPWFAMKTLFQYYSVRMMNLLLYTQFGFVAASTAITFFMLEKSSSATVRGGEVIPMLTSGFSRKRVAVPFFIVGCFFIFSMCALEEVFYANCRDWAGANSGTYTGKIEKQEMDMRNDETTGLKIYGLDLDLETRSFHSAKIGIPKERTFEQMEEILAGSAHWLPENDDHPSGYLLKNVVDLEKKNWLSRASHKAVPIPGLQSEHPVFFTSETASWVKPGELFFISMLPPEKLAKKGIGFLPPSIPELYREVNQTRQIYPYYAERAALHIRILRPFVEALLLFLLIPVILSARVRSKVFVFFCLAGLTGLNIGLVELGRALVVQEGIPASVGAWTPILVLVPLSAILFDELYT